MINLGTWVLQRLIKHWQGWCAWCTGKMLATWKDNKLSIYATAFWYYWYFPIKHRPHWVLARYISKRVFLSDTLLYHYLNAACMAGYWRTFSPLMPMTIHNLAVVVMNGLLSTQSTFVGTCKQHGTVQTCILIAHKDIQESGYCCVPWSGTRNVVTCD